jgi:hypothetical protein
MLRRVDVHRRPFLSRAVSLKRARAAVKKRPRSTAYAIKMAKLVIGSLLYAAVRTRIVDNTASNERVEQMELDRRRDQSY